jgi:hypothetical protein
MWINCGKDGENIFFIEDKILFLTFLLELFLLRLYICRANQVNYHFFNCQPNKQTLIFITETTYQKGML